jgi:hypothetical protein
MVSREILKGSQGIIKSEKDAREYESAFMALDPISRKADKITKQTAKEQSEFISKAKILREHFAKNSL